MVRKQDQEHVKALLTEAITVLCKNGLGFESELNIEALIGITLDKDEVFLVSIKETVNAKNVRGSIGLELSCEDVCRSDCSVSAQSQEITRYKMGPASSKRQKPRKRKHSSSSGSSDKVSGCEKTRRESSDNIASPTKKKLQYSDGSIGVERESHDEVKAGETKSGAANIKEEMHLEPNIVYNETPGNKQNYSKTDTSTTHNIVEFPEHPTHLDTMSAEYMSKPPNIKNLKTAPEQIAYLHTTETKLQVIQYAEIHGNRATGRAFDISEGTVRRWRNIKDTLIAEKTALI